MKEVALEQLTKGTGELFETAQRERVLVTRNGLPFAVVVGIENKDEEDFRLESSPEFWQMIEERRRETDYVSFDAFKAELEAEEKIGQKKKS